MNLIRIPSRLTDASGRVRRPFWTALRLANGEASSKAPAFFARAGLYWRKLLERRSNHRIPAIHRHTYLSVHVSQRLDLHFTWQPAVMRARQPTSSMTRSAAPPRSFLDNPLPPHRQSAMAAAPFRSWTAIAGPFDRREMAPLPLWPMALRRDNRSPDHPDASSIKAVPQRQIDRLDAIPSGAEGGGTKTLAWSRRVPMDRRSETGPRFSLRRPTAQDQPWPQRVATGTPSGAGPRFSLRRPTAQDQPWRQRVATGTPSGTEPGFRLRRPTAPDRLESVPVTDSVFARPTGAKRIDPGSDSVALTLADREQSAPPTQTPRTVPFKLVWRESAPGDDTRALAANANRRDVTFGEHAPGSSATDRSERANEKVITQAREAVRRELLTGPSLERLADDVMRRLEKRMRIERERRGL